MTDVLSSCRSHVRQVLKLSRPIDIEVHREVLQHLNRHKRSAFITWTALTDLLFRAEWLKKIKKTYVCTQCACVSTTPPPPILMSFCYKLSPARSMPVEMCMNIFVLQVTLRATCIPILICLFFVRRQPIRTVVTKATFRICSSGEKLKTYLVVVKKDFI